jgi:hypothetical protein
MAAKQTPSIASGPFLSNLDDTQARTLNAAFSRSMERFVDIQRMPFVGTGDGEYIRPIDRIVTLLGQAFRIQLVSALSIGVLVYISRTWLILTSEPHGRLQEGQHRPR